MKNFFKKLSIMLAAVLLLSSLSVGVVSAAAKPKLNKTKITLNVKKSYQLKLSNNRRKVKWSSSKKSVATVSSKGKITAKKKGTATITAKVGSKKYNCKVTVKQPVTSLKMNKKAYTLKKKGATVTLKASAKPSSANNKSVTWTSSNKKVATVSSKGKVKAVGNGTCTITAKAKDGSKKKATCKITVKIKTSSKPEKTEAETPQTEAPQTEIPQPSNPQVVHVDSVVIGPYSSLTLKKGETFALTAHVVPSNATNTAVRWSSSNNSVATVNSNGLVTAVGSGTATITLTSVDGGKTTTCNVTVKPDYIPVEVAYIDDYFGDVIFYEKGETLKLKVAIYPVDATNKAVTWQSSDPNIATVDSNGLVTAIGGGKCTITLTTVDGGLTDTRTVSSYIPIEPKPIDPSNPVVEKITLNCKEGDHGNDSVILGFRQEDVVPNINIREITFETSGDKNCVDYYEGYWNEMQTVQLSALKKGYLTVKAKYKGALLKTWEITITSDWPDYLRYENWKNGVKREICPSGNATIQTLDALKNYIQTKFKYALGGPASNKYYAWEKMECDCVGASGMFGDIASDFGFKVKYVGSNGVAYDHINEAVSYSSGHVNNSVLVNGQWIGYDAQPPHYA